jgi:hypothetical protein
MRARSSKAGLRVFLWTAGVDKIQRRAALPICFPLNIFFTVVSLIFAAHKSLTPSILLLWN